MTQPKRVRLSQADRRRRVVSLHRDGFSYRDIASAIGCSIGTVHNDVVFITAEYHAEAVADLASVKARSLMKLDRASQSIAVKVNAGELDAINVELRIIDARAKLLGLYAPAKVAHGGLDSDGDIGAPIPVETTTTVKLENPSWLRNLTDDQLAALEEIAQKAAEPD